MHKITKRKGILELPRYLFYFTGNFPKIKSKVQKGKKKLDIKVKEEYLQRATRLHKEYPVADAHLDLAGEILLRREAGEKNIVRNHYLKHWQSAGINLIVSSVYIPTKLIMEQGTEGAWENALAQIAALKEECAETEELEIITSRSELEYALEQDKIGILLYMEGLDCIGTGLERLDILHGKGVRGASLTWSRKNALATGCCKAGEYRQIPGELTKTGIQVIEKMEQMSWFLDVSHLNDDGFANVAELATRPFLATHSCAREVYDNYRNLTDKQMEMLAQKGGLMGLNGCMLIAGSERGNHLEMLCRHVEYELKKIGAEHICFGFDLCDSYDRAEYELQKRTDIGVKPPKPADCFLHHGQIPLLTAALLQRGMKEEDVISVMGRNLIKYLKQILPEQ